MLMGSGQRKLKRRYQTQRENIKTAFSIVLEIVTMLTEETNWSKKLLAANPAICAMVDFDENV